METFKFLSMRESFEENYKPVEVPAKNRKGYRIDYVYVGPWIVWTQDSKQVRQTKQKVLTACLISLVLYIAAAIQNSPVNYGRWISMFGLLSLAPAVFEVFGAVQFLISEEKLTNQTFNDISVKLKVAPVLHAILLLVCCFLGILSVFAGGYEASHLLIPACYGLAALEAGSIFWYYRKLGYKKVENKKAETEK